MNIEESSQHAHAKGFAKAAGPCNESDFCNRVV